MTGLISYQWTGEGWEPLPRFKREAREAFGEGEVQCLVEHHDRSKASHDGYFAAVGEAWKNLPEGLGDRFPTDDHLRKWALVKAGYRDERSISCASRAEAVRVAAFIRPMDEFAVVTLSGPLVTVYTAKSQSYKAMGKEVFQKSKDDVLAVLANLLDVTPGQLAEAQAA